MKRTYATVVWDWNGTLFDDQWAWLEAINVAAKKFGVPLATAEQHRRFYRHPVKDMYIDLGFDFTKYDLNQVGEVAYGHYETLRTRCQLHTGAAAFLGQIRDAGIPQYVLSAYPTPLLQVAVAGAGILPLFTEAIGSDGVHGHGKVEEGRRWLENSKLSPSEVILIGDSLHDHEVAETLGFNCLLHSAGHQDRATLLKTGRTIYHSFEDVAAELSRQLAITI